MSTLNKDTWKTCSNFGLQSTIINSENNKDLIDNLIRKQTLETVFCNDFICCEQYWTDLHELLQHCEECHCKAPSLDDDDYDDMLSEIDEDDLDILTPTSPLNSHFSFSSSSPSPTSTSFFSHPLSHIDLSMLENTNHLPSSSSTSPSPSYNFNDLQQQEEYGYEKIKEWMFQAQFMHPTSDDREEEELEHSYRPYRCHVPGCDKTYKNANGLKYHKAHGHCQEKENGELDDINQKPYICSLGNCKKRYKNLNGLKYHIQHTHFKRKLNNVINNSSNNNNNNLLSFPSFIN
ncbi:hypothetical protein BJ944DRAFT_250414 [Cunninghamella echinulata]|nr:hypothetical protein BJ944DRAFT_250414 [Cunninghamella echinulata]